MIFNAENLNDTQCVKDNLKAPYINATLSTLGGKDKAAIMINISLDDPKTWSNNIFHNSRYLFFRIDIDGTIECYAKQYTITSKFRKCKAKNLNDAVDRINKYLIEAAK